MQSSPVLRRPLVIAAVMAATFMIAIEATIVSTAMPKIAGQLGDLHLYAWVPYRQSGSRCSNASVRASVW